MTIERFGHDQFTGVNDWGEFTDDTYGRVSSATSAPTIHYVNEAGVPEHIVDELKNNRDIASQIEKWQQSLSQTMETPTVDVFNRRKWHGAQHVFANMSMCAWAIENDDILSTTADVVEGLMWGGCVFELYDADQEDVWNQWAATVNLDARLREMSRELLKVSQFYVGLWWERKTYRVRDDRTQSVVEEYEQQKRELDFERMKQENDFQRANDPQGLIPELKQPEQKAKTGGNRSRRKEFKVRVPTAMTIFDPTKIVPVGNLLFGKERFAYVADQNEHQGFGRAMSGEVIDQMVLKLIEKKYTPTQSERNEFSEMGISPDRLWLMREDAVFRHTLTKADYERFAAVRLKPILPLLEMKQHLRNSDRAALIGNANYIVVITKGSDKLPAKPAEIANLQEQSRIIARLPVLVGDHRLNVQIVAPPIDNIMLESRYQVIDSRLVFTMLRSYSPVVQGGNSSGTGVSEMSRVISKGLESRRKMLVRTLEAEVFQRVLDANEDTDLTEFPSLNFTPKRIALDLSAEVIGQILKLRDRGDISRETTLEELEYDQDVEVRRRADERLHYDRVFESVTPHSSPLANPYGTQQPGQPGQPGQMPGKMPMDPQKPGDNVGPKGQPRTEGGRPPAVKETQPRQKKS